MTKYELVVVAIISIPFFVSVAHGNVLYVGAGNYASIQDAINDAMPGDTIFVYNGTYYENVVINKSISLIGESMDGTIIDGMGSRDVILITGKNVKISNMRIRNSGKIWGDAGIEVRNADGCNIENASFNNNWFAIYISNSSNCRINKSIMEENAYTGIYLKKCNSINIFNNTLLAGENGVIAEDSNSTISENSLINCTYGIIAINSTCNISLNSISAIFGIYSHFSTNCIINGNTLNNTGIFIEGDSMKFWNHMIKGNTVNKFPVYFYRDDENFSIVEKVGEIIVVNSSNFSIKNQNMNSSGMAIQIAYCRNFLIQISSYRIAVLSTILQACIFIHLQMQALKTQAFSEITMACISMIAWSAE